MKTKLFYFLALFIFTTVTQQTHAQKKSFKKALLANDFYTYEKFLKDHPDSEYAPIIKDSIEQHAIASLWQMRLEDNTISGYLDFIERYPDSRYLSQAHSKISSLKEEQDYNDFKIKYDVESLRTFLLNYPDSKYEFEVLMMLVDTIPQFLIGTWDLDSLRIGHLSGDTLYDLYDFFPWIKEFEDKVYGTVIFKENHTFALNFMDDSTAIGNWKIIVTDASISIEFYIDDKKQIMQIEKLTEDELVWTIEFEKVGNQFFYFRRRKE